MDIAARLRRAWDLAPQLRPGRFRTGNWPLALGALLLAASAASSVATVNSPPVFTSLELDKTNVYEGESLTLTGSFHDPNPGDRHTVLVYWLGGDSNEKQKIELPAGVSTFTVGHRYPDIVPIPSIKVVVYDHTMPPDANDNSTGSAWDAEFLAFEGILDNKPTFIPNSIRVVKDKSSGIKAGPKRRVTIDGDLAPPGLLEPVQVAASWNGPGSPQVPCSVEPTRRHFTCETTYAAPSGPTGYPVSLRVRDDEGNEGTHQLTVSIP